MSPHLSLFTLRIAAGRVGVSTSMSVPLSGSSPLSGLHFVQVVHAAGWLYQKGSVGPTVAIAVASHSAVVRKGARWLTVEGVVVA